MRAEGQMEETGKAGVSPRRVLCERLDQRDPLGLEEGTPRQALF